MFTLRIPADVWDSIKIKPASTEVKAGFFYLKTLK